jgi:hypothetical protein
MPFPHTPAQVVRNYKKRDTREKNKTRSSPFLHDLMMYTIVPFLKMEI